MPKPGLSEPKADARRKEHHTIVSLKVTGGLLKGANLEFSDGLNCVIEVLQDTRTKIGGTHEVLQVLL